MWTEGNNFHQLLCSTNLDKHDQHCYLQNVWNAFILQTRDLYIHLYGESFESKLQEVTTIIYPDRIFQSVAVPHCHEGEKKKKKQVPEGF